MKQLYTYCKSITTHASMHQNADERAFIGAAVSLSFAWWYDDSTSGRPNCQFEHVPRGICRAAVQKLSFVADPGSLPASYQQDNKKEYMSSANAESCFNRTLWLLKQQNSRKSGIDGIKRHNVKRLSPWWRKTQKEVLSAP